MINRGSTAQAIAMDEQDIEVEPMIEEEEEVTEINVKNKEKEANDGEIPKTVSTSKVLSALKFGWNSVFSANNDSKNLFLSEDDLNIIIDRSRGVPNSNNINESEIVEKVTIKNDFKTKKLEKIEKLLENQEQTIENFDENAPLVSLREVDKEWSLKPTSMKDIADAWRNRTFDDLFQSNPNNDNTATTMIIDNTEEANIGEEYNEDIIQDGIIRNRQSRMEEIHVPNVGFINVMREKQTVIKHQPVVATSSLFMPTGGRQVGGRDYDYPEICQVCWDGGSLIICDLCPVAVHLNCLYPEQRPKKDSKQYYCPHHTCISCNKRTAAAGLLFRCDVCSNAYCEDCLPSEATIYGNSHRFDNLGFRLTGNCCYIHCSLSCAKFIMTEASNYLPHFKDFKCYNEELLHDYIDVNQNYVSDSVKHAFKTENRLNETKEKEIIVKKLDVSCVNDLKERLSRNNKSLKVVKFTKLNEIPNIELRLTKVHSSILSLLGSLVYTISQEFTRNSKITDGSIQSILNYPGIPLTLTFDKIIEAFLMIARMLTKVTKTELKQIGYILGICDVLEIKAGGILNEPKFR